MIFEIYEICVKIHETYEIHMEMYENRNATDIKVDFNDSRCERQHMMMMMAGVYVGVRV